MTLFAASGLSYSADGKTLVSDASFTLEAGTFTALVGPNGAGKTTLLRLASGILERQAGGAVIAGHGITALSPIERARRLAYLPQARPLAWPQPVRDIVALGRFAYGAAPQSLSPQDEAAIEQAMAACALTGFEERPADTLSGGEISRVHLARALAAQAPVLFADEPVAALDPRHAHEVLRIFRETARKEHAVLSVLHDLPLAARYADRLIWMKDGQIIAQGTPQETLTNQRLKEVFGVAAKVALDASGAVSLEITGAA